MGIGLNYTCQIDEFLKRDQGNKKGLPFGQPFLSF